MKNAFMSFFACVHSSHASLFIRFDLIKIIASTLK